MNSFYGKIFKERWKKGNTMCGIKNSIASLVNFFFFFAHEMGC